MEVAPSRERGLKPETNAEFCFPVAPSRERGLKHAVKLLEVVLLVAPSRERGLKLSPPATADESDCRSLTGAWIETSRSRAILTSS